MAVTPEGKIKQQVREVLNSFGVVVQHEGFVCHEIKAFWPVPSGMGESDLDCIVCYRGRYIAIETKAPGKKPTPRQQYCIARTRAAGGMVFVIDSEIGVHELRVALQGLRTHANASDS